jgi:hypothetical protein
VLPIASPVRLGHDGGMSVNEPHGQPQPAHQPQPAPGYPTQPGSPAHEAHPVQPGHPEQQAYPPQTYPAQTYPAHGYATQPGVSAHQAQAAAVPASQPARGTALANVAFIAGILTVLLGTIFVLVLPLLYGMPDPFAAINAIQLVNGCLAVVLGLAAAITGAIALVRNGRGPGRARASAGLVLGASALLGVVATVLQGLMLQFL